MSHITEQQRYEISFMLSRGCSQKEISEKIGKHKSVISREISRNKNDKGRYSFSYAQMCVSVRKERYQELRKFTPAMQHLIEERLKDDWSPEQIHGYCLTHSIPIVSIERIYQHIRTNKQQGGELYKHCRHKLKHRKRPVGEYFPIKNRVGIEERPIAADGTRFGDWEMDLIVGAGNKDFMLTLTERSTNYSIVEKLPYGKDSKELSKTVIRLLFPYVHHILSITTDNGGEFAEHEVISKKLKTQVYFTHPYSSWEKGAIENYNKLCRQYFLKNKNFQEYNNQYIKQIQYKINSRPRKKLHYRTPTEVFYLNLNKQVAFTN